LHHDRNDESWICSSSTSRLTGPLLCNRQQFKFKSLSSNNTTTTNNNTYSILLIIPNLHHRYRSLLNGNPTSHMPNFIHHSQGPSIRLSLCSLCALSHQLQSSPFQHVRALNGIPLTFPHIFVSFAPPHWSPLAACSTCGGPSKSAVSHLPRRATIIHISFSLCM
jgi:hypothetical protein